VPYPAAVVQVPHPLCRKVLDESPRRTYATVMSTPARRNEPPLALHDRAIADLRYIRETMERAGSFTAVPGWGGVAMGVVAFAAAPLAAGQPDVTRWLLVWLGAAVIAVAVAVWTMRIKARRAGLSLLEGPGRKFALSFMPPLVAGGVLTAALLRAGSAEVIPGVWLLLYGVSVATAGAFSVRIIPVMGLCFMAVGTAALISPPAWGDAWMAVGFGALQVIFGVAIARRHGG
jgi:hypothetical protein